MQPWWTERPWSTAAITARCSLGGQRGHDLLQLSLPDAAQRAHALLQLSLPEAAQRGHDLLQLSLPDAAQRGHDLLQLSLPDAALVDREATIYCSYHCQMHPWWIKRPWSARCSPGGQSGRDLLQLSLPDAALVDKETVVQHADNCLWQVYSLNTHPWCPNVSLLNLLLEAAQADQEIMVRHAIGAPGVQS